MSRRLRTAVIQMDAAPAPLESRLGRAADLIAAAAATGAQLIALPELFNTGYVYDDSNFALAERLNGRTVTWLKSLAAAHRVHLVGSILLLDEEDIYNAALLVAPDGRLWRYDKQYPFAWERAYFRENRHITIADTDLGKIGLMICWDAAHADLWARYAGKVDAMAVVSCPPKVSAADLVFPDGSRINLKDLGGVWRLIHTEVEHFPGADLDEHAAWMGVPVLHTVGSGTFRSRLPAAAASMTAFFAARPDLWRWIPQAHLIHLESGYDLQTKVIDAQGEILNRVLKVGDGVAAAEVTLSDLPPVPTEKQPPMRTSPLAYLVADALGEALATRHYRIGARRQWGNRVAPIDPRTRVWVGAAATMAAIGMFAGRTLRRGRYQPSDSEILETGE